MSYDTVPALMRGRDRWLLMTLEARNGDKPVKTPRCIADPSTYAKVNDPTTWGPFDAAVASHARGDCDGIGYVLGDGLVGNDLDACRDPNTGQFTSEAQEIIRAVDSYSEVSFNQTGGHIYALAFGLPGPRRRKGPIEIYPDNRFFVVTGQHIDGTPTTIEERTAELGQVYRDVFGDDDDRDDDHHPERHHQHVDVDDAALLDRARASKNGDQFSTLLDRGDISSYASPSEADLALCNHLAFWTGCDAERMAHLFRSSALMRPKWTSRRRVSSYGALTVERAICDCREVYHGDTGMPDLQLGAEPVDAVSVPEPSRSPRSASSPRQTRSSRHTSTIRPNGRMRQPKPMN